MSEYNHLYNLIYKVNRARYEKLPYAWNKYKTIVYLKDKIPELNISLIKKVQTTYEIYINNFTLKNSFGHSGRNIYVFRKDETSGTYFELLRMKRYSRIQIEKIIRYFKDPFIEKNIMSNKLPIDIKVHIFFGKICFFYIYYKSNRKEKARYDKNLNYISYNKLFLPNTFSAGFRENSKVIDNINTDTLKKLLEDSVKVFNNLDNLVYCSVDWLYDYVNHEYYFCELTPTPYVLSKYVKPSFIKEYIAN